jgi:hypothetical protein
MALRPKDLGFYNGGMHVTWQAMHTARGALLQWIHHSNEAQQQPAGNTVTSAACAGSTEAWCEAMQHRNMSSQRTCNPTAMLLVS